MGLLDGIIRAILYPGLGLVEFPDIFKPGLGTLDPALGQNPPMPAADPSTDNRVKLGFLGGTALVLGGIAVAPVAYKAYTSRLKGKRAKQASEVGQSLEWASNRATSLVAGILPAFAVPIAYIGVQELEAKGVISKGLGDSVQGLMTAGVVAPAIGNVIGSVAGAVTKR